MELHLLNRSSTDNTSAKVSHNLFNHFLKVWHFHEELELVFIVKSTGTFFVGDHIEKFQAGDLVLIGKNVPHMWLNDEIYFEKESKLKSEAVAIHFKEDFLGKEFFSIPEMYPIKQLFADASQGIKFLNVPDTVKIKLRKLVLNNSGLKLIRILEILFEFSKSDNYQLLSSNGFINTFHKTENTRLNTIYEYVFQNFKNNISARDIADLVNMNPSSFSRFFKATHRKSFTRFLNEIRIGFACKLLLENIDSITSIGYLCGFNNISNFNRQFKIIKGETPTQFSRKLKKTSNWSM